MLEAVERFIGRAGFERGPWMAVAFAVGIILWVVLDGWREWLVLLGGCVAVPVLAILYCNAGRFPFLRQALVVVPLTIAFGCLVIWGKSAMVGAPAIDRPIVTRIAATVLDREERPAEGRVRLHLAIREPATGRPLRVRVNLATGQDRLGISQGAHIRARLRLMPPAPPMLPGGYDFARTAWFAGISATGSVLGDIEIVQAGDSGGLLVRLQAALSEHVRSRLDGASGAIATAFASGDRGAIDPADDQAMRDSGLAHLLSISGLHVSALIAAVYFVALRLLALSPWLALRVRLPLLAAGAGATAGIGYTLLTGAEVPTVRSCIGALLVLMALALGREPLSLRMVAVAAGCVMLLWPEAVLGPSFQMSFAAVIAIVALHGAAPVRAFLAPRNEGWLARAGRRLAMLLLTGIVIELALMPIGLFHFHRAGVYGALANVVAIPLTTFVSMPLIALALLLDAFGAGMPAWWLAGKSIDALLALAHWVASRPGAVTAFPAMGAGGMALFAAGGFWLALWSGKARLLGLLPVLLGAASLALLRPPDILISGDGHHVGFVERGELYVLRAGKDGKPGFAQENLAEIAGMNGVPKALAQWPGARCNSDFCALSLRREGREWRLLVARSRDLPAERELAAACERSDIVIADRQLPRSCRPLWLKADRAMLARTGGMAIDLPGRQMQTVAETQGGHGWWRPKKAYHRRPTAAAASPAPVTPVAQ
ncbi:MAG TPA: ComEC/Rec2 family competence protein [Novosphingobium sp.]